jgi:hypothetical protein
LGSSFDSPKSFVINIIGTIYAAFKSERNNHQGDILINNNKNLVTLKGIIIPVDWDAKGKVLAIAISTHGEEEYLVCNDNNGKRLYNLMQNLVKVCGKIKEIAGIKIIKIHKFEECYGTPDNSENPVNS